MFMDNPIFDPVRPAGPDDPTRRAESLVHVRTLLPIFVWAVAILLFFRFFHAFKLILLGFLAAASLAAALRPLVRIAPGPRSVKASLIGIAPPILLLALAILAIWQMAEPIQRQVRSWPAVEQRVNTVLATWSKRFGADKPVQLQDVAVQLSEMMTGASGVKVITATTNIFSGLALALAFVFIGSIYLLVDPPDRLLSPLLQMLPRRRRPQVIAAVKALGPQLRWWLIGTMISIATIGVASWIGYTLVGLEFALPLALLAGLGEAIPTVGPLVTYVIALLFAATQGTGTVIGVTVVYLIVQVVESYILIPMVMKKAVDMPPVVTLFTLVLWGVVFGLPGLLLAIPINLVIWSFARHLLIHPIEEP